MMHLEILVEEPSMKELLEGLLPRVIPEEHSWTIHILRNFKKKLEGHLRGYAKQDLTTIKIVLISDLDRKNCVEVKQWLEKISHSTGHYTKTSPGQDGEYSVLTRIVIQELEAWILGDPEALHKAYSRIPESLGTQEKYRNPDLIGHTWEVLHALLKRSGYYEGDYPKIEVAHRVSRHMNPMRNNSHSFLVFIEGVTACIQKGLKRE
jgi:hypothetical protein